MKRLYAREPEQEEQEVLNKGLRSRNAFTVRRSQIILSSGVERKNTREIAEQYGISGQCVRDVIRAFEKEGIACLEEKSHGRHDNQSSFDEEGLSKLKELVRHSPRSYGHESSIWTLEMLAETCWKQNISLRPVSVDGLRCGLRKLGVNWQRAKHWINSPDPHYAHKKSVETG